MPRDFLLQVAMRQNVQQPLSARQRAIGVTRVLHAGFTTAILCLAARPMRKNHEETGIKVLPD
jgi:hypothetical protein